VEVRVKGHLSLKSIKPVVACQDYKNKFDKSNQQFLKKNFYWGSNRSGFALLGAHSTTSVTETGALQQQRTGY
jgi:hypothetical protein